MNTTNISNSSTLPLPEGGKPCYSGIEVVFECGGSYAGYCNHTTGSCVCINGWSGRSDWYTMDLTPYGGRVLDCQVHLQAVQIIYGLIFAVSSLQSLYTCIFVLPATVATHRKELCSGKTSKQLWMHAPLQIQVLLCIAIISTALLAGAIVFDPNRDLTLLGIHKPVSVIAFIYFLAMTATGHLDLTSRRSKLLGKGILLSNKTGSGALAEQIKRANHQFSAAQRGNDGGAPVLLPHFVLLPSGCG